ncbi:hypothetical protein Tfer_3167 [Thermincola ferriacetica]|uniref:Uncharacterized protein n=2 Tax=Thermincola ferriacetica TaxID=281456 RepID=A0A0L6VYG9_9FIRM|nr:hypothetical protein Tfer_3167 [Thermincola ferriacetica]
MEMKEILNLILAKVEGLEEGQTRLEASMAPLEERQAMLEEGQAKLFVGFKDLGERLDRVEKKLDAVVEQTAGLLEFRTETEKKLGEISGDIRILAGELGRQNLEIERIKLKVG